MARKKAPDFILFIVTLALLTIGVVMVFSASQVAALQDFNDSYYFLKRQLLWALIGIGAMLVIMRIDYWRYREFILPFLLVSFVLLVLVLVPGIGKVVNGARRWIDLKFTSFQPSELMKIALIFYTAHGLAAKQQHVRSFTRGMLPFLLVMAAACVLILAQPDLGTAVSLAGTVYFMLLAAGARWSHLAGVAGAGLAAVAAAIAASDYRRERFLAFLNPWKDPSDTGFHIIQSLYALGSGGLFGVGLGRSHQKFLYLPERHTDFIFAIIGEELGFLGVMVVLALFFLLIWRGYTIALKAPDTFSSLLVVGFTSMIAIQVIINVGVVTGSLPVTGIPLPLISYGGTSLTFTLMGMGVVLNVSRHCR